MAGALILNQYGVAEYGIPGAWSQSEEDGGGDKAGALILNQYGGPRCVWPERLSSTNVGSQVRGLRLKKTLAGTRPERLSSSNMRVSGAWSQPEEDRGGDKAGALILKQYEGFRCVVST